MAATRLREPGFASKLQKPGFAAGMSQRRTSEDRSAGSLPPINSDARESFLPPHGKRSASLSRLKEVGAADGGVTGPLPPLPRIGMSSTPPVAGPGGAVAGGGPSGGASRPPKPARPSSRQRATDTPPQQCAPQRQDSGARLRQRSSSRGAGEVLGGGAYAEERSPRYVSAGRQPVSEGYPPPNNRVHAGSAGGGVPSGRQARPAPDPLEDRQSPGQVRHNAQARSSSRGPQRQSPPTDELDSQPASDGAWPAPARGHMPPAGGAGRRARAASHGADDGRGSSRSNARIPQEEPPVATPEQLRRQRQQQQQQQHQQHTQQQQQPQPHQRATMARETRNARRPPVQPSDDRPRSPPIPTLAEASNRPPSPPIKAEGGPQPFSADGGGGIAVDEYSANEPLMPCKHCGRNFRQEALEKHLKICVKVFQQQRKQFNAMEHILPDEAKALAKPGAKSKRAPPGKKPVPDKPENHWRQQSEAFRMAIRDARMVDKCQKEGRPLPPPRPTAPELDDRVPCPHCSRRFGRQQAERHIPHCAKSKAKAKKPPARNSKAR